MQRSQRWARTAGGLYLYIIAAGVFAEVVRSRLVVPDDAAETAANIAANGTLFRLGFSAELLHLAVDVIVAVLLYMLLRPVSRTVALIAAFMRLACAVILAGASIAHFAVLRVIDDPRTHEWAPALLDLHGDAYGIALVFFGFACVALGYLVYRSRFLPRTLGVLLAIAGVCYLVASFANFLHPPFASLLFPAILLPAFIAELALAGWLLVRGVDMNRWPHHDRGNNQ